MTQADKAAVAAIARQTGQQVVEQKLNRGFGFLSCLGLAFAILNTWTAAAASFSLVLPSGGPSCAVWGLFVSGFGTFCMAASLGEMASVYPTIGGQYHFAALLSTPKWAPLVSWITGWFSMAGWWALVGTNGSLAGTLITGVVSLWHPDYTVHRWLIYVVYAIWIALGFILNTFFVRQLPHINSFALVWSIAGAIISLITVLACSKGSYQSAHFVFATTVSDVGWNDGVSWILGLLQSAFALTAFDSVMHLTEEMNEPEWTTPLTMVGSIAIGTFTGFIFILSLLFCVTDYDDLLVNPAGALLTIYYQATQNRTGATCLQILSIGCQLFAVTGAVCTAGRMTWSFARDGGLPGSKFFTKVVPGLDVPLSALIISSFVPIAYGTIFLGSSAALNAILSSSVVFLNLSYGIPILVLVIRGRSVLEPPGFPPRRFNLGVFGWPINILGLVFMVFTTVFFLFPPVIPVTALNMNYACTVIALIIIVSAVLWFLDGRKNFTGPRDIDGLLQLARKGLQKGQIIDVVGQEVFAADFDQKAYA